MIDVNGHPLYNNLYRQLQESGTKMEEFSHKCWGPVAPYTHHAGRSPIDGAYKSPEVEIVNLCMLTFAESPGDHRSLCFDISTRSLLGEFRFKICRPVSRRLVTSQQASVTRYNQIVLEQQADRGFARSRLCTDGDGTTNNLVLYMVRNDTSKKGGDAPRATD